MRARALLPMELNETVQKRHTPNCNLVCRVTCILFKETEDFLGDTKLTIFVEVNYI